MPVSVMIDVVIAAVVVLFAVLGWKRGLLRTLSELLVVAVAVFLAGQIANFAAPKVVDTFLRPQAHSAIEKRVDQLDAELEGRSSYEKLEGVLEGVPFVGNRAKDLLADMYLTAQDKLLEEGHDLLLRTALELADMVLDSVVRNLVRSIIFAVCFAVLTILLRVVVKMLNLTLELPGLKQVNEVGGMLLGLGKGLIWVCLVVWVLRLAGVLTADTVEESMLLRLAAGITGALESGI